MPRPARAGAALAPLALLVALAPPAHALDGAVLAAGLGTITVTHAETGLVTCTAAAPIAIWLVFEAPPAQGPALTGHYTSASACASFVYPIEVTEECTGGPGTTVRCDGTAPPRWFTLEPDGTFVYVRDNYGARFVVEGLLARQDAAA